MNLRISTLTTLLGDHHQSCASPNVSPAIHIQPPHWSWATQICQPQWLIWLRMFRSLLRYAVRGVSYRILCMRCTTFGLYSLKKAVSHLISLAQRTTRGEMSNFTQMPTLALHPDAVFTESAVRLEMRNGGGYWSFGNGICVALEASLQTHAAVLRLTLMNS